MEMLGLALAIPAVLVANVGYGVLAKFVLSRLAGFRRWLVWPSYLVLVLTLIEITLVATIGAVEARTRIGPTFWFLHLLVIFLGAPSLANVLILATKPLARRWYLAVAWCCAFGVFLVFFQVGVGDALFGVDGVGGPFSP